MRRGFNERSEGLTREARFYRAHGRSNERNLSSNANLRWRLKSRSSFPISRAGISEPRETTGVSLNLITILGSVDFVFFRLTALLPTNTHSSGRVPSESYSVLPLMMHLLPSMSPMPSLASS